MSLLLPDSGLLFWMVLSFGIVFVILAKYGFPVISCDSRQIYREMRIGTAVPSPEQLRAVRHYFIQSHSVK